MIFFTKLSLKNSKSSPTRETRSTRDLQAAVSKSGCILKNNKKNPPNDAVSVYTKFNLRSLPASLSSARSRHKQRHHFHTMEEEEASAAGGRGGAILNLQANVSHDAKLKELLHRITSAEIKLCSDATKEFVKLLKREDGGTLLREYVLGSPKCSELLEAWKLRQGKQGLHYVFELISALLSHREGKHSHNNSIARDLDKFARLLLTDYLNDLHKELNSKEVKRQKAALSLAASIVRRGHSLASEVAKSFDFKLAGFAALAKRKRTGEGKGEVLLRKSFVGFAMSFLEAGKPGLLRWVLQQREMYFGVLRGLGNDDDETVVFVLSTLRDRVLVEESLVPPGLRSVLFGSVTLEQLVGVCGREDGGGDVAEIAFEVLVLVCTDPSNGLMPDLKRRPNPLRGNPKRIMELLKKLWPTETQYHRDLLLAVVNARPSFGLSYLKEFPYNIENYKSSSWLVLFIWFFICPHIH